MIGLLELKLSEFLFTRLLLKMVANLLFQVIFIQGLGIRWLLSLLLLFIIAIIIICIIFCILFIRLQHNTVIIFLLLFYIIHYFSCTHHEIIITCRSLFQITLLGLKRMWVPLSRTILLVVKNEMLFLRFHEVRFIS